MSTKVIQGVGKPRIYYGSNIDLPYCDGLTEYFIPDFIQRKLYNGNINTSKRGWYYRATLDYSKRMTKTVLESLEPLFNISYTDFIFYPRRDNVNICYTVDFPADFQFQFMQRAFFNGHKGIALELVGTRRITAIGSGAGSQKDKIDLTNDVPP